MNGRYLSSANTLHKDGVLVPCHSPNHHEIMWKHQGQLH